MYQKEYLLRMLKSIRMFVLFCAFSVSTNLFAAGQIDDIRIVIDVSGSMKKTDPANLRVPAMKLLNGLIPTGSKAGVWTFGRYVNMTVKWGKVDAAWRKRADLGAEEIHSNALFTNIESALARATKGWDHVDPSTRRNLILLTDGQVDVSKDTAKNIKSRQAILNKSVKRLQKAGVHVQAIALSEDADEVLLKRLALDTDGFFEVAETAEDLQKIFFKMFERATLPPTISITDNQFKVDSTIKEMTLLVFRKPGSKATVIFSPDSNRISARKRGNSIWRSDEGYDLITIKKPAKGIWSIEADTDPDNRLMVVTDLRLELNGLPRYVFPGQSISLSAALYNKDKPISKNSFLRFVKFNLKHTDSNGSEAQKSLKHSKDRSRKGQYLYKFAEGLEEGQHSILVTADSRTFNRSRRVDVNVQWPVKVSVLPTDQAGFYNFSVESREEYLVPESLQPSVFLESPDGKREALALENRENRWIGQVETVLDGLYNAQLSIEAKGQAGEAVKLDLGKFSMLGVYRAPLVEESTKPDDPVTSENDIGIDQGDKETGPDWVFTSIIIGVSNLVIILLAVGVYLMIRRKSTPAEFLLE